MKKSFGQLIACILVVLLICTPCLAISVTHNGTPIAFDVPPANISGRVMVPMRAIFEELGAEVEWDPVTQTAIGRTADTIVTITIGKTTAYVNDTPVVLDVPAQIINSRTLVPVRFISESLNTNVHWDDSTKTVRIVDNLYTVTRVVDGDTLEVDINGKLEKVRLIGIDTPESVHPDDSKNTEAGIVASEFTKSLVEGKQVELEFDVQERDMYGRLLAYVYVNGVMLNKTLLEKGYAVMSTYPPNVRYVDQFRAIVDAQKTPDPTTPSSYTLTVTSITSPVSRNQTVTVTAKGKPNTQYNITVYYSSGPSTAAGLETKTADADGNVSWSWKVGSKTNPGTYSLTVSGGGDTVTEKFVVK